LSSVTAEQQAGDAATEDIRRRPGRPREAGIEQAVLRSAVELIRENGPGSDFTIGDLVGRSGVSRAAIYRRWENRKAIIVAALDFDRPPVEVKEASSLLETLKATYVDAMDSLSDANLALINTRLALGLQDPELQREYWERHVSRRRTDMSAVLERAKTNGEIRQDADIDVVLDMINGTAYYQGIVRGDWSGPASRHRLMTAIELIYHSIAA
jgi:AcrR family transcriptional regulator